MFKKLSQKLYEVFIFNTSTVAFQRNDGNYSRESIHITPLLLEKMLEKKLSFGTYQQQNNGNLYKWICFDFDCPKDSNLNILDLKNTFVKQFIDTLKKFNINYLIEYSGRRGIHIWIIFDSAISKENAWNITSNLVNQANLKNIKESGFHLDLFPATGIGKSKFGKMVKIPLSKHQLGKYSYFLRSVDEEIAGYDQIDNESFIQSQYEIIEKYIFNSIENVLNSLEIKDTDEENSSIILYKKQFLVESKIITLAEIKKVFLKYEPLAILWKNIDYGTMTHYDRLIILGVFAHISSASEILDEIFKLQKNYNSLTTINYINKYKNSYFPITMKYLYSLYNINLPNDLSPELTVLDILAQELNHSIAELSPAFFLKRQKLVRNSISNIALKELNYLSYNDEVIDVEDYNSLKYIKKFTLEKINKNFEEILIGNIENIEVEPSKTYLRKEANKERRLISLSTYDRTLTTALALEFCKEIGETFNSYSYHINLFPEGDVFIPWISSWNRFKLDIKPYFKLELFNDMAFIKLDITNFYDSIYFHSIHEVIENNFKDLSSSSTLINILKFFEGYTEELMRQTNNKPWGVPQGPAYARVIAEFYLSSILKLFFGRYNLSKSEYLLYRYVDDIYLFYYPKEGESVKHFYNTLGAFLESYNLKINLQKSRYYEKIQDMSRRERDELDAFANYEIKSIQDLELIQDKDEYSYQLEKIKKYLSGKNSFTVHEANFILNDYIDPKIIELYLEKFYTQLITSEVGRGSIYRKFYSYIFRSEKYAKLFFAQKDYTQIPITSINFKNFTSKLYFMIDEIILALGTTHEVLSCLETLKKIKNDKPSQAVLEALEIYISKGK